MAESKTCVECGKTFMRKPGRAHAQWDKQECCTKRCANALRARGHYHRAGDLSLKDGKDGYQREWSRRKAMPRWADWWESQRRAQDLADLAMVPTAHGRAAQRISERPNVRLFNGGVCKSCGATWVSYADRDDTAYCSPCNARRWRTHGRHKRRVWKASAQCDVISPEAIFHRDGYRCQLCGSKTRGKFPALTSPTLDHIIPLSRGGDHTAANLQCACFSCNSRKGSRSANEQLRLIG